MKNVNNISICRDNYSSREEWEDAIKKMVISLLENRQILVVRYDEPGLGIVDIEFNPNELEWGCHYLIGLAPQRRKVLFTMKIEKITFKIMNKRVIFV